MIDTTTLLSSNRLYSMCTEGLYSQNGRNPSDRRFITFYFQSCECWIKVDYIFLGEAIALSKAVTIFPGAAQRSYCCKPIHSVLLSPAFEIFKVYN